MTTSPMVLVHGGAGASAQDRDGCEAAAQAGLARLRRDGNALLAAVAAVTVLEDDPRFNAGTGSSLGMDGVTIEMDASVMDTRGKLGAVACLRRVRNPVQVAAAIADTPQWLLCGEGAQRFARNLGLPDYDPGTQQARDKHQQMLAELAAGKRLRHGSENTDFTAHWNYPAPLAVQPGQPCDTVGAIARDADGHFAVACSTGGAAPSLLGRVGDTPIIGAGFYAGPAGVIAVTGIGEFIVPHLLAYKVHEWIAGGMPLAAALDRAIALFDPEVDIGLIALNRDDSCARSNRDMPTAEAYDKAAC